jgi:hypothetical protein
VNKICSNYGLEPMIWSDSAFPSSSLSFLPPPYTLATLPPGSQVLLRTYSRLSLAVLFCLPAKNNALSGYYDPNSVVTAELANSIPDEVGTVFWE